MILLLIRLYDGLDHYWHKNITSRITSTLLIIIFASTLLSVAVVKTVKFGFENLQFDFFLAIDSSFTALLIMEILGLIFVLPKSVADSVGKQFEILSIILLRSAFKEFGHVSPQLLDNTSVDYYSLLPMLADAMGALFIFAIIGFYYRQQKHEKITKNKLDQIYFINFKKLVALLLLIAFLCIGVYDIKALIIDGHYNPSFNNFYTLLIFSDVLILLFSLRYQSHYTNLFRYSSYAFATVLIRLSLSAPSFLNVIIGIIAGSFVLGLTFIYNKFREKDEVV